MNLVERIVARRFPGSGQDLVVGGLSIRDLAAQYGTPVFVYDAGILEEQWSSLRGNLPGEVRIYYSVKANPNLEVLRFFIDKGAGLEIASEGEFALALHAGCKPEHVLYAGPGKRDAELELVLSQGIGEIHAESIAEIERIQRISRRLGARGRVAVRVNPSSEAQGGAMRMGGKSAPFGIVEEQIDQAISLLLGDRSLEFRGIHLFSGTQILDAEILAGQYRKAVEIASRLAEKFGCPIHTVDFGGGLGIPYFPHEQELEVELFGRSVSDLLAPLRDREAFRNTQFVIEPGRFLVGEAGVYISRVVEVKESRGKTFVIMDGGMNHHLAASGNLGQVIKRNFPIAVVNKLREPPSLVCDVVGPLCTPLDTIARDISLPAIEPGDLIGVLQSGAYARSASPLAFLSHASPPEVLVQGGRSLLARRRGTPKDLFRDMSVIHSESVSDA